MTFNNSSEVAGDFRIRIRTFPDKNLTEVESAIKEAFSRFEKMDLLKRSSQNKGRHRNKFLQWNFKCSW